MPSMSRRNGFTIVEMLIVIPLVLLMIGVLVGFVSVLTGDSLNTSTKNTLAYDARSALDQLEQDVHLATEFRSTGFDTIKSPQGLNNDSIKWDAVTAPAIILRTVATTKNPLDPSREIVYKNTGDCSTSTDPYMIDVVYYFTKDSDDGEYHMWRRVVFDGDTGDTPCTTPWQRSSCAPGQTGAVCQTEDAKLADNIFDRHWYYADVPDEPPSTAPFEDWIHPYKDGSSGCTTDYDAANILPACAAHAYDPYTKDGTTNAKSLYLELTMKKTVAGEEMSYTANLYSTRLNSPPSS